MLLSFVVLLGLLSSGDLDALGLLCEDELDVAGVAHVGYIHLKKTSLKQFLRVCMYV